MQTWNAQRPSLPKYRLLQQALEARIAQLHPGDRFPSERELEQEYGVSRITVRQALQQLVLAGKLERIQGRGTFVARPKVEQGLVLTSFSEEMRRRGLTPGSRTLANQHIPADAELAARLAIAEGAPVIMLTRLRLANGEPMALETVYISAERFPLLAEADLTDRSLYAWLAEHYGIELTHGEQTIEAVVLTPQEARLFGLPPGLPAFRQVRLSYDQFDRPVELVRSLYRGDRYKLFTPLTRPPQLVLTEPDWTFPEQLNTAADTHQSIGT